MTNKKVLVILLIYVVLILTSIPVFTQQAHSPVKEPSRPVVETEEPESPAETPPSQKPALKTPSGSKKKQMEVLEPLQEEGGLWQQKFRLDWSILELSSDQKAQIKRRRKEFMAGASELREKLKSARLDLRDAIFKDQADPEKVKELSNRVADLELQLGQMALQNLLEIKKILTPAQLKRLPILASNFTRRWKELDLTQEQQAQLSALDQEFEKKRRQVTTKIQSLTTELKDLIFQPSMEHEGVEKITQELAQAKKDLIQAKTEFLVKSRAILTPSQLEKLATLATLSARSPNASPQAPTSPPETEEQ